jgi:hypothetical protein
MKGIIMTNFVKANFITSGDYVFYGKADMSNFIARFKHRGPITKAKFMKELIANHTVESYFAERDAGKAPVAILRDANENWFYDILEKFSGRKLNA